MEMDGMEQNPNPSFLVGVGEGNELAIGVSNTTNNNKKVVHCCSKCFRMISFKNPNLNPNPDPISQETPPHDDCCPICFGDFTIACKTNCGHWFCGNCILQYWNYSAASSLQRCKCPICTCLISKLTPAASGTFQQEEEFIKVLENVETYNSLFVGGVHGFNQKVLKLPLVMRGMLLGLMDPGNFNLNYHLMRFFALLLGLLYEFGNFDFLGLGRGETVRLFEYIAIALVFLLALVGICRKQLLRRRVRLLAAA